MNVNPGELRANIKIITEGTTADADGYPVVTRSTFHECKGKFSRTSGTEAIKSNADFADIKARVLIRYTSKSITRKMLVEHDSEDYEIEYMNDYDDRHEYIELVVSRVVTA